MSPVGLLAAWHALAQAPSPEEIAAVEKAIAADAGAQAAARQPVTSVMNPDISVVGDLALAWFSADEPPQTGAHDPRETGFTLQQLELSLSKAVDPYFRFDGYLVFGQTGVEIEEAFATTLALPASLQARAGQFLTRFGRQNATHPHAWEFVDQPFALGRVFGGEGNRGLGVEASWLAPLPWYLELVASVTGAAGEGTARSFYGPRDLGVRSPLDLQTTLACKQFFPLDDDWSLLWGLSGAFGPNGTGHSNRTDVWGTDLYVRFRPVASTSHRHLALQSEWLYRRRQVPDDVLSDVSGYAQLALRFALRWTAAVRWEYGSASWSLDGGRRVDGLDPGWDDDRQRASVALTFTPTEFSRLRVQGAVDAGGPSEEAGWAAMLAFEFLVGAHGAHPF